MDIKYSYYRTAAGYKIVGGTAGQFLKADGSVDSTSYAPSGIVPLQALSGGINSVKVADTRNVNQYPSTDLQSGVWFDFKSNSTMGITSGANFAAVMTFAPWSDNSGNFNSAFRLSQTGGEMYFQNYSAAGAWGAQNRLIHINNMNSLLWSKYTTGNYTGVNAATPFSVLNGGSAQNINCGGLLVSNQYADIQYVPTNGAYFKGQINTDSWVIPKYLAFPDSAGSNTNKVGFYYWTNEWQVNFRDANNTYLYPLLNINVTSKKADFFGVITNPEGDSTKWSQAYGWGNHALAGYATNNQLTYKVNAGNSTYGLEWDGLQTYLRRNNTLEGYLFHSGNLNLANFAAANHTHTFGSITSKPTTIAGYGITDAYTKNEVESIVNSSVGNAVQINTPYTTAVADQNVMLSDNHIPGVTGMLDIFDNTFYVGREINGDDNTDYLKIGSKINETNGINIDNKTGNIGIGLAPGADRVMAKGLVVADGFKTGANLWSALLATNGGQVIGGDSISIQNGVIDLVVYNKVVTQPYNITSSIPKFFFITYAGNTSGDAITIPDTVMQGTKIEVINASGVTIKVVKGSTSINVLSNQCVELYFNGVGWIKKYNTVQYF
jgi:hypothetical protein